MRLGPVRPQAGVGLDELPARRASTDEGQDLRRVPLLRGERRAHATSAMPTRTQRWRRISLRISRGRADGASGARLLVALTIAWLVSRVHGLGTEHRGDRRPGRHRGPIAASASLYRRGLGGTALRHRVTVCDRVRRERSSCAMAPPTTPFSPRWTSPANALVGRPVADAVSLPIRPAPRHLRRDAAKATPRWRAPIRLTFKYPVHFAAPSDSRARYPTDVLFEQALVVALAERTAPNSGPSAPPARPATTCRRSSLTSVATSWWPRVEARRR